MLAERQRQDDLVARVEQAERARFQDRPVYKIGDVLGPVAVVEDAYRLDDGRRITEVTEDVCDPDLDLLGAEYPVSAEDRAWFLTFISPEIGAAGRVRQFAARLGFKAYWPRAVRMVRRGRAKKEVVIVSQVFPRYVLVHLPARWVTVGQAKTGRDIRVPSGSPFGLLGGHEAKFNGIACMVKVAGVPIWIPDVLVKRIVHRERHGSFDHTTRQGSKRLAKLPGWLFDGAFVKVVDGPFASFPGLIEEIDVERSRVKVAVSIFGRATPVELDIASLESV